MSAALKIFIIYAREDEPFKISLLKAFKPLHRTGKIEIFHDGLIKPGERWEEAILENLRTAHIILPLVSTDFFDSEFIHEVEFKKAVERYNKGETTIIPIILKHCGWKYDPVIPQGKRIKIVLKRPLYDTNVGILTNPRIYPGEKDAPVPRGFNPCFASGSKSRVETRKGMQFKSPG